MTLLLTKRYMGGSDAQLSAGAILFMQASIAHVDTSAIGGSIVTLLNRERIYVLEDLHVINSLCRSRPDIGHSLQPTDIVLGGQSSSDGGTEGQ